MGSQDPTPSPGYFDRRKMGIIMTMIKYYDPTDLEFHELTVYDIMSNTAVHQLQRSNCAIVEVVPE